VTDRFPGPLRSSPEGRQQYTVASEVMKVYEQLKEFDEAQNRVRLDHRWRSAGGSMLIGISHVSQRWPRSDQGDRRLSVEDLSVAA
jgi:hypothetical protein